MRSGLRPGCFPPGVLAGFCSREGAAFPRGATVGSARSRCEAGRNQEWLLEDDKVNRVAASPTGQYEEARHV